MMDKEGGLAFMARRIRISLVSAYI